MLVVAFFQWWYGPGWADAVARVGARLHLIYLNFSLPILGRTLFAPWRRIVTPPGRSLQEHAKAALDNAVSRAVGFSMRLVLLLTALILLAICAVGGGLFILLWPVIPVLGPILIVVGLV